MRQTVRGTLGKRIGELRKQKGITQEMLSKSIGVTTQAISKWECGGTPDAMLLPSIADALGITIENLFLETEEEIVDIRQAIGAEMASIPKEDRYQKAFELCKALQLGYSNKPLLPSTSIYNDSNVAYSDSFHTYYSLVGTQEGISIARLKKGGEYFFVMPEEEESLAMVLTNAQDYVEFFSMLAKPNHLKMLLFFYSRGLNKFTEQALASELELELPIVLSILEELKKYVWIEEDTVETEHGMIKTYGIRENIALLPMLYTAEDVLNGMNSYLYLHNPRTFYHHRPLLNEKAKQKLNK